MLKWFILPFSLGAFMGLIPKILDLASSLSSCPL